jgi:hypothetical protein
MKNHYKSIQNSSLYLGAKLLILVILVGLLSSCNSVLQEPVATGTTIETTSIVKNLATQELTLVLPAEVATEMPTDTATPEPTATATEVLQDGEISSERKQEIIDRVNAFINAEGQYSDEELRKDPTWFYLDIDKNKPLPLGMLSPGAFIQSIFVDYEIINNNYHLFLGTLLRTGERAVFDYSYPGDYFDGYDWKQSGISTFSDTSNFTKFNSIEEQNLFFDSLVGKPFTFLLFIGMSPELAKLSENMGLTGSSACQDYMMDINNLVPIIANAGRRTVPNDYKQSVLYFTKNNPLKLDDFSSIENNVLCGAGGFTIRKP